MKAGRANTWVGLSTGSKEGVNRKQAGAYSHHGQYHLGIIRTVSVLFLDPHDSPLIIQVQSDLRYNMLFAALLLLDDLRHQVVTHQAVAALCNHGLVWLVLHMDVTFFEIITCLRCPASTML